MRNFLTALAAVLAFWALAFGLRPAGAAEIVAPSAAATPQKIVTLAAGTDTVLGSAGGRRYLCVMNIGTGLVTLGFDQAAVAGSGWALAPATAAGQQGGAMCWEASLVTVSVVHAISAAGSTVALLEAH